MTQILHSLQETLHSPQQFHAAMVHLPIAASVFGLLALIALLFTAGKNNTLRWSAVAIFAIGAATGFLAEESGEEAMMSIEPVGGLLSDSAADELETHEEMGERVWLALLATSAVIAVSAVKRPWVRITALSLGTAAAIAAALFVAITAHHGGQLVYRHGAGVPDSSNNNTAPVPAATQPSREPA